MEVAACKKVVVMPAKAGIQKKLIPTGMFRKEIGTEFLFARGW
jgi:hypothetical protein